MIYKLNLAKEYFHFCAAHFIVFDQVKREQLHGHNYYVSVQLEGNRLTGGKLLDIAIIKPIIKQICDELDHKTILPTRNSYLSVFKKNMCIKATYQNDEFSFPSKDVFLIDLENTTMENLADYIINELLVRLPILNTMSSLEVKVEETNGQSASLKKTLEDKHE
jgi:6-pyruvoyltetrahydropterin/6-carboxytetrahydropterin synthase